MKSLWTAVRVLVGFCQVWLMWNMHEPTGIASTTLVFPSARMWCRFWKLMLVSRAFLRPLPAFVTQSIMKHKKAEVKQKHTTPTEHDVREWTVLVLQIGLVLVDSTQTIFWTCIALLWMQSAWYEWTSANNNSSNDDADEEANFNRMRTTIGHILSIAISCGFTLMLLTAQYAPTSFVFFVVYDCLVLAAYLYLPNKPGVGAWITWLLWPLILVFLYSTSSVTGGHIWSIKLQSSIDYWMYWTFIALSWGGSLGIAYLEQKSI